MGQGEKARWGDMRVSFTRGSILVAFACYHDLKMTVKVRDETKLFRAMVQAVSNG